MKYVGSIILGAGTALVLGLVGIRSVVDAFLVCVLVLVAFIAGMWTADHARTEAERDR